jgi:hypothetical protein
MDFIAFKNTSSSVRFQLAYLGSDGKHVNHYTTEDDADLCRTAIYAINFNIIQSNISFAGKNCQIQAVCYRRQFEIICNSVVINVHCNNIKADIRAHLVY